MKEKFNMTKFEDSELIRLSQLPTLELRAELMQRMAGTDSSVSYSCQGDAGQALVDNEELDHVLTFRRGFATFSLFTTEGAPS